MIATRLTCAETAGDVEKLLSVLSLPVFGDKSTKRLKTEQKILWYFPSRQPVLRWDQSAGVGPLPRA